MSAAKVSGMTGKTELLSVRLDHDLVKQLDALAESLSRPGLAMTRTDAVRVAVVAGLEALKQEKKRK